MYFYTAQNSAAEARIREMKDRQNLKINPVTLEARGMSPSMPSPGPLTPGENFLFQTGVPALSILVCSEVLNTCLPPITRALAPNGGNRPQVRRKQEGSLHSSMSTSWKPSR